MHGVRQVCQLTHAKGQSMHATHMCKHQCHVGCMRLSCGAAAGRPPQLLQKSGQQGTRWPRGHSCSTAEQQQGLLCGVALWAHPPQLDAAVVIGSGPNCCRQVLQPVKDSAGGAGGSWRSHRPRLATASCLRRSSGSLPGLPLQSGPQAAGTSTPHQVSLSHEPGVGIKPWHRKVGQAALPAVEHVVQYCKLDARSGVPEARVASSVLGEHCPREPAVGSVTARQAPGAAMPGRVFRQHTPHAARTMQMQARQAAVSSCDSVCSKATVHSALHFCQLCAPAPHNACAAALSSLT